jgi:hypothetical protein
MDIVEGKKSGYETVEREGRAEVGGRGRSCRSGGEWGSAANLPLVARGKIPRAA